MRSIVILVVLIFLTTAGAGLLIATPHGELWALCLALPMIWLAQTWAAALSPQSHAEGAISAQLSVAHLALNAYAFGQFAVVGALWLVLPSYWLAHGGGMPAALCCAAAATAWLILYRRRWAYSLWIYYQPANVQSAPTRRLTQLARELESRFWAAPEGSVRAANQFWRRGIWLNALDAVLLLLPIFLLVLPVFSTQLLRNWLAYCALLLPALALLRVQLGLQTAELSKAGFVRNNSAGGLSGAFDTLDWDEPREQALPSNAQESRRTGDTAYESRRTGDTAYESRRTGDTAYESRRTGDTANESRRTGDTAYESSAGGLAKPADVMQSLPSEAVTDPGYSKSALLIAAISSGDVIAVASLLKRGADPNAPAPDALDQRTPLVLACATGGLAIIKLLIAGGSEVNRAASGLTPLLAATRDSWSGRFDVVMTLLTNGADVHAIDHAGVSALHGAARSTDVALLQLLLESGAALNIFDSEKFTPLARAVQAGQTANALALLKAGAAVELEGALNLGHALALCREPEPRLLDAVIARIKLDARDASGNTALHACAMEDAVEFATALVAAGANVNAKNQRQQTPLMCAAQAGCVRTALAFGLAKALDASLTDAEGNTALHHAAIADTASMEMIDALLSLGAPAAHLNANGASAADLALKAAHWDQARRLSPARTLANELEGELEQSAAEPEHAHRTEPKREQLLIQAARAGRYPVAHTLLKLGVVDQHTHLQTLLALGDQLDADWLRDLLEAGLQLGALETNPILCALARQIPPPLHAIEALIGAGASVTPDAEGDTPLLLLCGAAAELEGAVAPLENCPPAALIAALLERGAQLAALDRESRSCMSYAVQWCDLATIQALIAAGTGKQLALNTRDSSGQTPLLRALHRIDAAAVVSLLIIAGSDPNMAGRDGRSARAIALSRGQSQLADQLSWPTNAHPGRPLVATDLVDAAARGDQQGVQRLLQLGFAIDASDSAGATALVHACATGAVELIEFLLNHGAQPGGAHTQQSLSPLAAAVRGRHFDVIRRLVALGAPVCAPMGELSCLSLAAGLLDLDCVTLLLELGASTTPATPLLPPVHAVVRAVLAGGELTQGQKLLQVLIQRGADPDASDSTGRAPLMMLVGSNLNSMRHPEDARLLSLIEILLRLGANPQIRDQHQRGTLHWCCRHALFQAAELLLDAGADPLAVDEFRKLPADMATTLNRHDFLALFRG